MPSSTRSTARVVRESSQMGELYHMVDAAAMRRAFVERDIAKSRREWRYLYDPWKAPLDWAAPARIRAPLFEARGRPARVAGRRRDLVFARASAAQRVRSTTDPPIRKASP